LAIFVWVRTILQHSIHLLGKYHFLLGKLLVTLGKLRWAVIDFDLRWVWV